MVQNGGSQPQNNQNDQKPENPFLKKEAVPAKVDPEKPAGVPINPFAINGNKTEGPKTEPVIKEKIIPEKKEIIEAKEVEVVGKEPQSNDDEGLSEDESIWTVLESAGITKKTVIVIVSVLVVLIVGLIIFLSVDFGGGSDEESPVSQTQTEVDGGEIDSSIVVGLEHKPAISAGSSKPIGYYGDTSGLTAVMAIGNVPSSESVKFVEYITLLDDMQNLYVADIYAVLDKAVDRRAALDEFIEEMNAVIVRGETAYNNIQQEMTLIDREYQQVTASRDQYETFFFEATQNLYGRDAYQYFLTFVDLEKQAVELKSKFNANKTLSDMFANSVNAMKPRHQDIVANVDALIRGVHVFDVPGSDINAIIRLGER